MQNVTILGSTGTIGQQTLDVIFRHPDKFQIYAITAQSNVALMFEQCQRYHPRYAAMLDEVAAENLAAKLKLTTIKTVVLSGMTSLEMLASCAEVNTVMAAIVGAAGLKPAMAAARAGKRILLANKETLVMSGSLFMQAVEASGAELLPIDSEHNAIFQVMPSIKTANLLDKGIKRIMLTASGGPFRNASFEDLQYVTPEQALNHPNWKMGPKITIDSATLMNKGLEVIEAHWLFNAMPEEIDVVVHPQSVIHSMVEYVDGSVLAQLGNPDMRTPIAYALGYPERLESGVSSLDLLKIAKLEFESPDVMRFPCLKLAFDALKLGGTAPAVLNGANEIAVAAFLSHQIGFMDIPKLIEDALNNILIQSVVDLEQILEADVHVRRFAKSWLEQRQ